MTDLTYREEQELNAELERSEQARRNAVRAARWRHRACLATGRIPDGNVAVWQFLTGSFPSTERGCASCGTNHNRHGSVCRNCEEQ